MPHIVIASTSRLSAVIEVVSLCSAVQWRIAAGGGGVLDDFRTRTNVTNQSWQEETPV
jgi:5-carboxymethyl-2-hydroxymuconate isomerase